MTQFKELAGTCVPVCTPFDSSGENIDEGRYLAHIDAMIDAGVDIILPCGGTGEFAYLRPQEKRRLIEITGKHVEGRTTYLVQTSAINTTDTIDNTKHAEDHGADAVMILPPYFEGPDMEGVYWHYEHLAANTKAPIMVYNIPDASGIDITPADFSKLLEIDQIQYIKDSTGNFVRIQELLQTGGKIFNGGDPITFQALQAGCPGCVWGSINFLPNEAVELFDLVQKGQFKEANALWQRILPSQLFLWSHVYNPSVKAAANMRGYNVGDCRMPVQPLNKELTAELESTLKPLIEASETRSAA
ncbi:MAG: dihydrodipicolinate synthase family protein [Gammaproteobacteria bacterium]|nr:dihydrodipicolinate synthase family protein [Gammaproteobacteria bacterium]